MSREKSVCWRPLNFPWEQKTVPATAPGRAGGDGHSWMAAIASCPLPHTSSHLKPTGYFCQVKKQRQETKALRKAAVWAGAGVGQAVQRQGGDTWHLLPLLQDLFNDCFSLPLFHCCPQPCNLQLLNPCSVIQAGDHSPSHSLWQMLLSTEAGGWRRLQVHTDHSFSLPMTSRFSTPGGFWPQTRPSQFSRPHPLAPSFSPCLRSCQFAPSLVSPVASTHTPTMTEHLHLPCGGLWFFRQPSTASRSPAHRAGCVSAAAGMWSDLHLRGALWVAAAAQCHTQHVQHPSLCSKAGTSLQALWP